MFCNVFLRRYLLKSLRTSTENSFKKESNLGHTSILFIINTSMSVMNVSR